MGRLQIILYNNKNNKTIKFFQRNSHLFVQAVCTAGCQLEDGRGGTKQQLDFHSTVPGQLDLVHPLPQILIIVQLSKGKLIQFSPSCGVWVREAGVPQAICFPPQPAPEQTDDWPSAPSPQTFAETKHKLNTTATKAKSAAYLSSPEEVVLDFDLPHDSSHQE